MLCTSLILFIRFLELCKLLVSAKTYIIQILYHDEKSCFDLIFLHLIYDIKEYLI
jgi:hypothetical protein